MQECDYASKTLKNVLNKFVKFQSSVKQMKFKMTKYILVWVS